MKLYYSSTGELVEPDCFDYYLNRVQPIRRDKVNKCKNGADKRRSLVAGILLRHALLQEKISYDHAVFSVCERGKPRMEGGRLFFSISHANELAVCVISDRDIGVDIEDMERFQKMEASRMERIASRSFSQREQMELKKMEWNPKIFAGIWTRKESYTKYIGKGLGMELSLIDTYKENYITIELNETYVCSLCRDSFDGEDSIEPCYVKLMPGEERDCLEVTYV